MKERKYKEDYGFRTFFTDKGREKREAVYQGDYFRFSGGPAECKTARAWALGTACLFLLFYLIYMRLNTPSGRCMYVMPVSACALLPFVYWCMGLFTLYRAPEKMTRLQKENGIGRVLRSSIGCTVLLFIACIGDVLYILIALKDRAGAELPGFALLCCAAVVALGCFLKARECYNRIIVCPTEGGNTQP